MVYLKFRAIDRLKDYKAQRTALENIPDEIATIQNDMMGIKAQRTDSLSVSGGGSRMDDKWISDSVRIEELKILLDNARRNVNIVDRGMEALSQEDRNALWIMYVEQRENAVSYLVHELNLHDERSVYKRLDKAIRRLTIAMYGCTEM